jgi:ribosomal protein L15
MTETPVVVRTDEEITFDRDTGKPIEKIRVMWRLGDQGPFYARFPKEGFTGAAAKLEIERLAEEVRALHR